MAALVAGVAGNGVAGDGLAADRKDKGPRIFLPEDFVGKPVDATLACSPSSTANMTYHNGSVMTTVTAYTIYWTPNNTITAGYQNLVNRYFQDIGGSAFYNINVQYFQNPGPTNMQNNSTFGGSWVDTTNAYPGGRGTGANPLLDQDIRDEVLRAVTANPSWGPPSLSRIYFVYTERGIESMAGTVCTGGATCTGGQYCAYHWDFSSGGNTVIYSNMPYVNTWNNCGRGDIFASPNGNLDADMEISTTSHEHFEAATDPLGNAWYDCDTSGEDGDKCSYRYGTKQPDGHNVVLNGNRYIAQQEWSNAAFDGTTAFSGCVTRYQADVDLQVTKSDSPDPVETGSTLTFNIDVKNLNGTFEGSDVSLSDYTPSGTTFSSVTAPAGWTCTAPSVGSTGSIACSAASLAKGATASFSIGTSVSCALADGATIGNTASVASTSSDPSSGNNSASSTTLVHNPAPSITCPTDISVECTGNCGTTASNPEVAAFLGGAFASDNCGVTSLVNNAPSFFGLGSTTVTFTATDSGGATASCQAHVTVVDTKPPVISVTLSRYLLWPPNHKLTDISAAVTVTDVCDPHPTFVLTSITSNEPDNGTGDGDTANDIQNAAYGTADTQFSLRSERSGRGTGRVYTIVYTASDKSGNTTPATVKVYVAHDQSGSALTGAGFNTFGTGFAAGNKMFDLTVTSTPDFDATRASSPQVGNTVGTIDPVAMKRVDVNCDGLPDLIVSFPSAAAKALQSRSAPDDPLAFRYNSEKKEGFLVPNIFDLGSPSSPKACAGF